MGIDVSNDHRQARIRPTHLDHPRPLAADEIIGALEEANIVLDEQILERIKASLAFAGKDDERPGRLLVAGGTLPSGPRMGQSIGMSRLCGEKMVRVASEVIHEGVVVRIRRRIIPFHPAMRGPLKTERQTINNVAELVGMNELTGSVKALQSIHVVEESQEEAAEPRQLEDKGRDGQGR